MTSSPISTSEPGFTPACPQRLVELLSLGRRADDPEPLTGAEHA